MEHLSNVLPAMRELAFLVGQWDMELSNASFLPDLEQKLHGSVSFELIENGALLVMRQGADATWVIGRDDSSGEYKVLYSDSRAVSRIYSMSLKDGVWKIWRDNPGFSQRYEGRVSEDQATIIAHWEKSSDGNHWGHDFDMVFTKKG